VRSEPWAARWASARKPLSCSNHDFGWPACRASSGSTPWLHRQSGLGRDNQAPWRQVGTPRGGKRSCAPPSREISIPRAGIDHQSALWEPLVGAAQLLATERNPAGPRLVPRASLQLSAWWPSRYGDSPRLGAARGRGMPRPCRFWQPKHA